MPDRKSCLLTLAVLAALSFAGCAAVQPISDAERGKIASVTINATVTKPPAASYLGSMGGLMFGAAGAGSLAGSLALGLTSDANGVSGLTNATLAAGSVTVTTSPAAA